MIGELLDHGVPLPRQAAIRRVVDLDDEAWMMGRHQHPGATEHREFGPLDIDLHDGRHREEPGVEQPVERHRLDIGVPGDVRGTSALEIVAPPGCCVDQSRTVPSCSSPTAAAITSMLNLFRSELAWMAATLSATGSKAMTRSVGPTKRAAMSEK